jgi:hypothetical protein
MRLRPSQVGGALFDALDDDGRVVATGTLEVELIPGAQRHGSLQFVTPDPEQQIDPGEMLARAQAGASV